MIRALGYVRDLALHGQAGPGGDREALAPPRLRPRPQAVSPQPRTPQPRTPQPRWSRRQLGPKKSRKIRLAVMNMWKAFGNSTLKPEHAP